jgi:FemAB-related protein (PEP-CTERM system-associated)
VEISPRVTVQPLHRWDVQAAADWDRFVMGQADGSICHLSAWRQILTDVFGHGSYYLQARGDSGELRGVLPLIRLKTRLFGDYMVSVPVVNYGGPCATDSAVEAALAAKAAELAAELGVGHIELRTEREHALDLPVRTDKVSMRLALPGNPEALWSGIGSKLRAQVKRPKKEGAEVVFGRAELIPEFYAVFSRNMRDLGTPVYPRRLFERICQAFPEQSRIVVVRVAGVPAAAGFLLGHLDTMEIPWASALREYNRIAVNMLLYWSVLEYSIEQGYQCFDFGRSSVESGTFRFKKQWGAEPHPLYWYYWMQGGRDVPGLTPNNPKYQLAIRAWQRLPLSLANWLGPKIVKGLP